MPRKATPRRTADAGGGEDDEDRRGGEEEEEDDQHVLIYVKLLQLLPVSLMQDTTFILSVLAKDLRAGSCPRSCWRTTHLCTPRLGSMPPCGNTCQSICGTGAASCVRRCGATASHLSMQPVRQLCQPVSALLHHFSITSDRTNGRKRNPRRTRDISDKKIIKTKREGRRRESRTNGEAAAAKQDGDERAESQPQRRRRCTGPRRPGRSMTTSTSKTNSDIW